MTDTPMILPHILNPHYHHLFIGQFHTIVFVLFVWFFFFFNQRIDGQSFASWALGNKLRVVGGEVGGGTG